MNKKMLTIESLANGYRNQEFLPSEILELYLNNIDEQSKINAYISLYDEKAREIAAGHDKLFKDGKDLKIVHGIPISL